VLVAHNVDPCTSPRDCGQADQGRDFSLDNFDCARVSVITGCKQFKEVGAASLSPTAPKHWSRLVEPSSTPVHSFWLRASYVEERALK
jgi:hypothetical protein